MSQNEFYAALLDSLKDQFVYVDNSHIIRYMNKVAIAEHKDGERLIGQSIFRCHSDKSRKLIMKAYEAICEGAEEILISDKKKKRIYMRAVRDKRGGLLGYYERFEYIAEEN